MQEHDGEPTNWGASVKEQVLAIPVKTADTILALKMERVSTHGILRITGRDVEEKDYAMKLDGFGWYLEGDAEEFNMPSWKKLILDYLKEHEKITPTQLSDEAGNYYRSCKETTTEIL